jgi:hypothetical protein
MILVSELHAYKYCQIMRDTVRVEGNFHATVADIVPIAELCEPIKAVIPMVLPLLDDGSSRAYAFEALSIFAGQGVSERFLHAGC